VPPVTSEKLDHQSAAAPRLQPVDPALRSRGCGVFYTTWMRWIRTKGLPAKKIGGRYYIDLNALDAWIAAQGVAAVTAPPAQSNVPRAMSSARAKELLDTRRPSKSKSKRAP
jgi:hypothetical protein